MLVNQQLSDDSQSVLGLTFLRYRRFYWRIANWQQLYRKSDSAAYTITVTPFDSLLYLRNFWNLLARCRRTKYIIHRLNKTEKKNESQTKSHCTTRVLNNEFHFKHSLESERATLICKSRVPRD